MMDGAKPVFRAIDRWTKALSPETIAVIDSFDRVAGCSIKAPKDMPPGNISALDGWAVEGAGDIFLRSGMQEMGKRPLKLRERQAVFVPTGAPLPWNGRFVMREHVLEQDDRTIRIRTKKDERKEWERGSWLKKGTLIIEKGRILNPEAMEKLSLAGMATITVYRKPCAAIMTTGDEIRRGVVPDSNRHLLSGLIQRDRGASRHLPTAPDGVEEMADVIRSSLSLDLLIITGGTAKGKKDVTREALNRAGAKVLIDKPRIMPGKTMAFGLLGTMPFFLLPGNPKSIRTLYDLFVRRCLMRLQGVKESERKD